MKKLRFSTIIHAGRETVWEVMLTPATYEMWTAEFAEGSRFEGSWAEGERIRFLGPDGSGMSAVIAENRPHEYLSIKHVGVIKHGVEDTTSDEVRAWAPAFENYTLANAGGATELTVDMDVTPDFEEYMQKTWPRALSRLKALCEAQAASRPVL